MMRIESRPLLAFVRLAGGVVLLAVGWCAVVGLALLVRVALRALQEGVRTW